MNVSIGLVDGGSDDFVSLHTWLSQDRELRGRVHTIAKPIGDSDLGSLPDVISVALGAGGAGTVLASSLITWLQTRRTIAKITVNSGQRSVTLDIRTVHDVQPLLEQILRGDDES